MCLPNILFAVFIFAFIFHCRSFSLCWPLAFLIFSPPLRISMFFVLRNSSPLFSITRSSSFSVIHVSVNIKNNAEKDTTLLLFFLSKSLGGHVIPFQIKPWVAFGLPYLSIELFYIGRPVVGTGGRSLSRCTVTWLPNFLGCVDYHICWAMGLSATRWAPLKIIIFVLNYLTVLVIIVFFEDINFTESESSCFRVWVHVGLDIVQRFVRNEENGIICIKSYVTVFQVIW